MDFYITRYSENSNSEINELYRSAIWRVLSSEERLDALQELENRAAEKLGNQPCEICTEEMNGSQYGYYYNGKIYVNESLINNGTLRYVDETGNVLEYIPNDTNAQMMDTIHHENYHAYQNEVIHGWLEHNDQQEIELWRANEDMYISSSDNGILYRIQSQERTAFDRGEQQTKIAFEELESKYGDDAGYQEYLTSINQDSYKNALTEAQEMYEDENIQETLDFYMVSSYMENHADESELVSDIYTSDEIDESNLSP